MIKLTIFGEAASKANSRKIVTIAGRPASIKSSKALAFERSALLQIPEEAKQMIDYDVSATIKMFYATRRPDLDESIVLDVLQAKYKKGELIRRGVYINDRQVKEKHIYHGIDKACPRVEIEIRQIDG
jgi:Holliday junction resolvase RusA-like endonuclease